MRGGLISALRAVLLFIVDSVLFLALTLGLLLPVTVLLAYRLVILGLVRARHGKSWTPLTVQDAWLSYHRLRPGTRPIENIGACLRVKGVLGLDWTLDKVRTSFLGQGQDGAWTYPALQSIMVDFGGYRFRKPCPILDLRRHVYEVLVGPDQSLEDYVAAWMGRPYEPDRPAWEIVLVRREAEDSAVLLKICHADGDGYNLIHFLDRLTGEESPYLVKDFGDSWLDKVRGAIQLPRAIPYVARKVLGVQWSHPFPRLPLKGSCQGPQIMSMLSLDLGRFKALRRGTGVQMTSVFLAVIGGVVGRLRGSNGSKGFPKCIQSGIALPWPNHPLKTMINHWTTAGVTVPLESPPDPLARLQAIQRDLSTWQTKGLHKGMKRVLSPLGNLLPTFLVHAGLDKCPGLQTNHSSLIGPPKEVRIGDCPVTALHILSGTLNITVGLMSVMSTYMDQLQVLLVAEKEVADLFGGKMSLAKAFVEEFENLERAAGSESFKEPA